MESLYYFKFNTLFISMQILSQNEYDIFSNEVKIASTDLENKEKIIGKYL